MIAVTENAKQALKTLLDGNTDTEEAGLRMVRTEQGQLSLVLDMEKEGDQIVEHSESKILMVDDQLAQELEGITLDFQQSPEGSGFVMLGA
ncbi:MAG: iron-sulfur cluster assembly accessory protein [Dehalococcoidia bacterium]